MIPMIASATRTPNENAIGPGLDRIGSDEGVGARAPSPDAPEDGTPEPGDIPPGSRS